MNLKTLSIDSAGYFFTNRIHIFLMPALLTFFWNLDAGLALPFQYYLMITFTTAGGYIYNMYTDKAEDAINYTTHYRLLGDNSKLTRVVIFLCFFLGFLLSLHAGWAFVLYGCVANFLGGLYSSPLRLGAHRHMIRIKEIPFLKNVYAGIFWSVALVLTPYFYVGQRPGAVAMLTILISFGLNYFVELMWDLRDMRGDRLAGVRTLPLVIGERAVFWILRAVHLITCLLVLWGVHSGLLLATNGWVTVGLYFPIGLLFFEWYRRLPDKTWASHVHIVIGGLVMLVAMASQALLTTGV